MAIACVTESKFPTCTALISRVEPCSSAPISHCPVVVLSEALKVPFRMASTTSAGQSIFFNVNEPTSIRKSLRGPPQHNRYGVSNKLFFFFDDY